jgi:membrane-bound lytic murein transglycosylase B
MIHDGNSPGHIDVVPDSYASVADKMASSDKRSVSDAYFPATILKDQVCMNNRLVSYQKAIPRNTFETPPGNGSAAADMDGAGNPAFPAKQGVDRSNQTPDHHSLAIAHFILR